MFDTLCEDVRIYLLQFLSVKCLIQMENVNKYWYHFINKHGYKDKTQTLLTLISYSAYLSPKVYQIFGDIREYYKLPIIVPIYYTRDYVDYIRYETVPYPLSRGVAYGRRSFLCFKITVTRNDSINYYTIVLFQRYTEGIFWTIGECPTFSHTSHFFGFYGEQTCDFKKLIKNGYLEDTIDDDVIKITLG
jgi:hypothetical protein